MDYFETIERQKQLKKIMDEWLDTPFRHRCGVKKLGCDCIHFAARVAEEIGFLKWADDMIPDYPKDWHIHNTRELLKEALEKNPKIKRIALFEVKNGDVLLSHFGMASSHIGFYFDGYMYQALNKIGVCRIRFSDKSFKKRMKFAYRLLE